MTDDPLQSEVTRLRAEVESHRQRELADLRSALAFAREESQHFRQEAQRIAEVGRQIAAEYEGRIKDLQGRLDVYTRIDIARGRTATNANRGR